MSPILGSVFWLLVTLGVLVTFHEFGHYWVARRCGVKVLRFSVGFGRPLWRRVAKDGTEYQIAAIPLGGYVKMLDAREGDVAPEDRAQEFTGKPIWQRIAIVAAGPVFNLIFAIAAFWATFVIGRPDAVPFISVAPNSLAAQAGMVSGDRIVSIDGNPTTTWSEAGETLVYAVVGRSPLPLHVQGTDGTQRDVVLPLQKLPSGGDVSKDLTALGLSAQAGTTLVGAVTPGDPAARAGVQGGDRIISVNGRPLGDFEALTKAVQEEAAKSPTMALVVERAGKQQQLTVIAEKKSVQGQPPRWLVGIAPAPPEAAILRYPPGKAFTAALQTTWNTAAGTLSLIGKMVTGQASAKNLSGVIGIAQVANDSAGRGLAWFLTFLGSVSLSLAVLNLLPIPVLDGGHLLYYLIELVKGRPVSERTMIAGQYVGLALLFTMMGVAFFNDIQRIFVS
ncbi:regulator of sigma E protease [Luteibacter sp. Sphag1AF]|uniref:RIP metalloprotease RseP n=1 Tax=Luteibacter sp. Sphag1AF TaxID=2587031 RepID=UPI0016201B2E|nr:RIP metalloprotease RseP [Luteibacter sp. Sphag1AF]MBB3225755.1 regulator of sigma E protease [Luteibacter sp. Sphag1AF]